MQMGVLHKKEDSVKEDSIQVARVATRYGKTGSMVAAQVGHRANVVICPLLLKVVHWADHSAAGEAAYSPLCNQRVEPLDLPLSLSPLIFLSGPDTLALCWPALERRDKGGTIDGCIVLYSHRVAVDRVCGARRSIHDHGACPHASCLEGVSGKPDVWQVDAWSAAWAIRWVAGGVVLAQIVINEWLIHTQNRVTPTGDVLIVVGYLGIAIAFNAVYLPEWFRRR